MIWTILLKFFSNPKIIVAIVIAAILGTIYYKYTSLQSDFADSVIALKQERDNNATLRDNLDTITQVNVANERLLQQQVQTAKTTVETINKLSIDLKRSGQSFTDTQSKIDSP